MHHDGVTETRDLPEAADREPDRAAHRGLSNVLKMVSGRLGTHALMIATALVLPLAPLVRMLERNRPARSFLSHPPISS